MSLRYPLPKAEPINSFEQKLRRYDPTLFLYFNPTRTRWQIWRTHPKWKHLRTVCVMTIENPDKSYREPDIRALRTLQRYFLMIQGFNDKQLEKMDDQEKQAYTDKVNRQTATERRYQIMDDSRKLCNSRDSFRARPHKVMKGTRF